MLLQFRFITRARYLTSVSVLCMAFCLPFTSSAQCVFETDFSDPSEYSLDFNSCDSNPGIFGYSGGRFTVNDMEGINCGNSDNELRLNRIDISEYTNLTITFRYTIRDLADGFECTSVFGNGDDQISLSFNVDGAARGPLHVFCCLLYTSPSPRDKRQSRMPSSA